MAGFFGPNLRAYNAGSTEDIGLLFFVLENCLYCESNNNKKLRKSHNI